MPKFVCVYSDSSRVPLGTEIEASYMLTNDSRFELSKPLICNGDMVHDTGETMPVRGNLWHWEEVDKPN
ncbi:hypothetical protein XbC2_406 [Xanthomonas phage XbC2]|nr:hypothetical protein XbC2_406 [Xanthomonas phage XbC2]